MKADAQTEAAIMAVMKRFFEAYETRDLDGFLALFAPDDDVVLIGTGADEKRVGMTEIQAQVERDWSQSDSISLSMGWYMVSAAGPVAWLSADVAFQGSAGGQEFSLPGRLTGVLEKRGESWLMVQAHLSAPLAGQAEGESF